MIPNLFGKRPLPNPKLTKALEKAIKEVKKQKTKSAALKKAYNIISRRKHAGKWQTYIFLHKIWLSPEQIMKEKGFLHCSNINYLLRILLINSGKFKEEDIKHKFSLIYYLSPHQYMQVKTEKGWTDVDPWGAKYGLKLGQYAHSFNV